MARAIEHDDNEILDIAIQSPGDGPQIVRDRGIGCGAGAKARIHDNAISGMNVRRASVI